MMSYKYDVRSNGRFAFIIIIIKFPTKSIIYRNQQKFIVSLVLLSLL